MCRECSYFVDERDYREVGTELREQIAKEIEMCHELRMAFANLNKCNIGECSHIEAAKIVMGQK